MEACGITRIECPRFVLAVQNNPPAVEVVDEAAVPAAFKEVIVTVKIDKAAVRRAIEAGEAIAGAVLTRGTRLVIR